MFLSFQASTEEEDHLGEDDIDLFKIVGAVTQLETEINTNRTETEQSDNDSDYALEADHIDIEQDEFKENMQTINEQSNNDKLSELGQSMGNLSLLNTSDSESVDLVSLLKSFGFSKFIVPPLLCRHPPPAVGRDDDVSKIKDILDDILVKLAFSTDPSKKDEKILCGPDNKIGKCLLQLMSSIVKQEFPLLHLRKSKITIQFSAYKDAGLVQLLRIMRDDDRSDWSN